MSIYRCETCGELLDNDLEPCTVIGNEWYCENCTQEIENESLKFEPLDE